MSAQDHDHQGTIAKARALVQRARAARERAGRLAPDHAPPHAALCGQPGEPLLGSVAESRDGSTRAQVGPEERGPAPSLGWLHAALRESSVGPTPLQVEVETTESGTTIRVSGELDIATVPVLAAALRPHLDTARPFLYLDLGAVEFLAAAGVQQLVTIAHAARRHGTTLAIVSASAAVRRVLALSGLTTEGLTGIQEAQPRIDSSR
jgi:anti-sigma B factor antagonist